MLYNFELRIPHSMPCSSPLHSFHLTAELQTVSDFAAACLFSSRSPCKGGCWTKFVSSLCPSTET
ncbi:rCG63637 [Rattus norvegicus]|uniref:RCG63637 n=1 Tax=Rattus norvegicus TaxID=10116 RepID=A6I0K8_RAT|nr:rCG63637 [Rattus norvegicus]